MFGIGGIIGGLASSFLGGGGGGGGLLGKLFGGGGLSTILGKLLGGLGGGQGGQQPNSPMGMLGDIHQMLSQLVDGLAQKGGSSSSRGSDHGQYGGQSQGGGRGEGPHRGGSSYDSGHTKPMSDQGCCEPRPERGDDCGGSRHAGGCDGAGDSGWDGRDKSPSMDREQGAYRLLEQAKNTSDPQQKQELVEMALEMLGQSGGSKGPFGKIKDHMDGNSYDKDIVGQANKMMDRIGDGDLNDCNKGQSIDNVIDMLMNEGGVDGKPAGNDHDGNGYADHHQPMAGGLYHAHNHMMHR